MTIPTSRPMTADELVTLPDDDMRHELVRGVHRVIPPPGARHGLVAARLAELLRQSAGPLGVVLVETGFVLSRDPDTVRAPDVAFVRAARIPPAGVPDGYIEGAPDLAVEIVSPSDTLYEVEEKVAEFLAAGARLVWVVNPRRRTVTAHAPGAGPVVAGEGDTLGGGDVLPGFGHRVAELTA